MKNFEKIKKNKQKKSYRPDAIRRESFKFQFNFSAIFRHHVFLLSNSLAETICSRFAWTIYHGNDGRYLSHTNGRSWKKKTKNFNKIIFFQKILLFYLEKLNNLNKFIFTSFFFTTNLCLFSICFILWTFRFIFLVESEVFFYDNFLVNF
jgi:hypothetical protein